MRVSSRGGSLRNRWRPPWLEPERQTH